MAMPEFTGEQLDYRETVRNLARRWQRKRDSIFDVVSWSAAVVGIASVIVNVWLSDPTHKLFLTLIAVAIVAVISLIAAISLQAKSLTREKYAHAISLLHLANHILRDGCVKLRSLDEVDGEFQQGATVQILATTLSETLNCLSHAFSIVIGSRCRATFKTLKLKIPHGLALTSLGDDDLAKYAKVKAVRRDPLTAKLIDEEEELDLMENERFHAIFKEKNRRCWVENNIIKNRYPRSKRRQYEANRLPYNSELIVPVRHTISEARKAPTPEWVGAYTRHQKLYGFLIVDSVKATAFDEILDFEMCACVADTLYIFLEQAYQMCNREPFEVAEPQDVPRIPFNPSINETGVTARDGNEQGPVRDDG